MEDLVALYQTVRSGWIVLVILILAAIALRVYRPGRKTAMEAHARIPFADDRAEGGN
ncbi:cbb3-type cytochrome oxidase subunit 3 [Inquilinus sp. OTU3971]|uniref:cbb3-type cytochrome oxidase subunit 3 n=1 Tax=Inquilinus sp. OTU3971 TaxID=3043855 RepID=UPI00313C236A